MQKEIEKKKCAVQKKAIAARDRMMCVLGELV